MAWSGLEQAQSILQSRFSWKGGCRTAPDALFCTVPWRLDALPPVRWPVSGASQPLRSLNG